MSVVLKEWLVEIWKWLKKQITLGDIKWLKKHRVRTWHDFPEDPRDLPSWETRHAKTLFDLSDSIKDVLDVKAKRTEMSFCFGGGLPKEYILQLARMLKLNVTEKTLKIAIVRQILEKIKMEKIGTKEGGYIICDFCRGYREVYIKGERIKCPKCKGVGKIRRDQKGPLIR